MGNVVFDQYRKGDPAQGYERWLEQNPSLIGKQILAENKIFRVSSYKLNGRSIVIKAFFKKQTANISEQVKIFDHFNRQIEEKKTINFIPLKLIQFRENSSFVVAYRQKVYQTLEELMFSKPSPTYIKKKWIIYQMIHTVATLHKKFNFYHGHLRSSNFVFTSFGYVMLTDFAFYKPLYMFEDSEIGLPQFRLFYGSSTANCTVAPEKMKESGQKKNNRSHGKSPAKLLSSFRQNNSPQQLQKTTASTQRATSKMDMYKYQTILGNSIISLQKMDIFSLGCTILELLRDGKPSLSYEQLLKLKKNQFSLDHHIKQACQKLEENQIIYNLLKSMLSVNPEQRPQIDEIQKIYNKTIDTDAYSLILHCVSAFSISTFHLPDLRICLIYSIFKFIQSEERSNTHQFKIRLPRCLQSFQALKIFKSILKNKIIIVDDIQQGSILSKILNSTDKEEVIDSEEQIFKDNDSRRQFFIPQKLKRITSVRLSTSVIPKLEKVLCPPMWDRDMMRLIQMKQKGMRLTSKDIRKNRFQDLLQQYKQTQYFRQMRKSENQNYYYQKFGIMIRVIYSCIRGCKYNASKLIGVEIMIFISREISDTTKLTRVLPYLISLLDDPDLGVSKYVLNSIIDLFYLFIDPFSSEEDTTFYDLILETLVNDIKTSRLRLTIFQRLTQILSICEWLEVHIKKICKTKKSNYNYERIISVIKQNYANFSQCEIRELIVNMPIQIWPDIFQFFISFINSEKVLGLKKSIEITQSDVEVHKKKFDIIDSCVQSALEENGLSLFYAIKYFTTRRLSTQILTKKIGPMVIHPHLWVRTSAQQFIRMCLQQNPPTRIFFLFYEIFEPPFPLLLKDLENQFLLPQPLQLKEVDFSKKQLKLNRKIGFTQNKFIAYLKNSKASKYLPITKDQETEIWNSQVKNIMEHKLDPIPFDQIIRKAIYQLFQANFLFYIGNTNAIFNTQAKQDDKKQAYLQFNDTIKKLRKFSLDDQIISQQKKEFFVSLLTLINTNFEKLLTKSGKFNEEEKGSNTINKITISQNLYLIMETLYKFQQFQIRQTMKLGEYQRKNINSQKLQRPKGQLITQIYQHRDVVSCLQNIADNFLITGSYDGTVRVFNMKKIQMNVTADSQIAYQITSDQNDDKAKINSISAFSNTSTFVVGTNKGQIRVFQVQKMPSKGFDMNRQGKGGFQVLKYSVGGQIEKVITFKNDKMNQCLCFLTAEGNLGIQDIRMKSRTVSCNLGKERGIPKILTFSPMGPSLLIGTLDGYILTYDIRCNIISNIRQLHYDQQPLTITGIYQSAYQTDSKSLFAVTYPSKHYQFAYFDLYDDKAEVLPQKYYSSSDRQEILSLPTMMNKTKQQNFKLCNNSLAQKIYYKQLPDFNRNFKILDYLSDPFTIKQSKIREVWMDRCKHRYNQIYSIYNKKSIPFIEHLQGGILTHLNPSISNPSESKLNQNLCMLMDKKQIKEQNDFERSVNSRPIGSKINSFAGDQNSDYLTCSSVFSNMVVVGGWDSVVRIYK